MPPIILPQAFFQAPNTFKPVSHVGAMNNTSSIKFQKRGLQHAFMSQNQSFVCISFYRYISVHCPKTQALSLKFLPLYFRTLSQNPSCISFFYHYISVHCPKIRAKPGVSASLEKLKRLPTKVRTIFFANLEIYWNGMTLLSPGFGHL